MLFSYVCKKRKNCPKKSRSPKLWNTKCKNGGTMRNEFYWKDRMHRAQEAAMHVNKMEQQFPDEINASIENTHMYSLTIQKTQEREGKVGFLLHDTDSVTELLRMREKYYDKKIAVLNFASYKNPGGMFLNGSGAQEECLCAESTLYNVLKAFNADLRQTENIPCFYAWNRKHLNHAEYLNRALYSPNIIFSRNEKIIKADVLTCAAPNYKTASSYQNITKEQNSRIFQSRISFLADICRKENVDILIAGAYGCGVFGQDPAETAELFLNRFSQSGTNVVFAVPTGRNDNGNFEAFQCAMQQFAASK